jgi:hypothetical protein
MNRREFLSNFAGFAALGVVARSTVGHAWSAVAPSQPTASPVSFNFGPEIEVIELYEVANETFALLAHRGRPFWLVSADGLVWRTTTPPWHLRRKTRS